MAVTFNPESHFFADPAAMSVQTSAQAFGPATTDEFRLTTKLTVTASKAYAICSGVVLVQPQTGSTTKVNVILRPYDQPIKGLNIKYFIYRGLTKSNFFTGNNVITPTGTTSDFINKINTSFTNFYTTVGQPKPTFLAKYIGFDEANQPGSLMLDEFFFKESKYVESGGEFVEDGTMAFELPKINKGQSLGNFAAGVIGIDIVLSYGDYKLPSANDEFVFNLAYARATEAKITLTSGMSAYEKKVKREQIFQFLDAAAYFGFHANEGGSLDVVINGVKETRKGASIYTGIIDKFNSKNKLYLYIQSDRTRSYNFYGNYKISDVNLKSLKIGVTDTALSEADYATTGWPVIINTAAQNHSNAENKLFLQFVTDNNVNTMLYGQVAKVDNAQKENFCDANNLQLPPDSAGVPSKFTKIVTISNPNTGNSGSKLNIASFNILIYQGSIYTFLVGEELDDQDEVIELLEIPNFFDDVFEQLNAAPLYNYADNPASWSISNYKVKLVNHYYNQKQYGISAVQTTIIKDKIERKSPDTDVERTTFLTETLDTLNTSTAIGGKLSGSTKTSPSLGTGVKSNPTYQLPSPFYYERVLFTDGTDIVVGLRIKALDESIPDKILLGLTTNEIDIIKDLVTLNLLTNARLLLKDLYEDGNELISSENIKYQKYRLGVVGEDSVGNLKLVLPIEEILIYSVDRKYHCSKAYSEYMPDVVLGQDYLTENIVM